ncbi:MAG: DUF4160 domain-containing protein [Pyrinomonadaceae bacterium]
MRFERALVERLGGSRIEIRTKEQGHNIPHFHYVGPDVDASFDLETCEIIAGNVNGREKRKIERFFFENGGKEKLKTFWDQTRPGQ